MRGKLLLPHSLDIFGVEPVQLVIIEHSRGLADAFDGEGPHQLRQGEDLLVVLGRPAQQGDVVGDDLGKIPLLQQPLELVEPWRLDSLDTVPSSFLPIMRGR